MPALCIVSIGWLSLQERATSLVFGTSNEARTTGLNAMRTRSNVSVAPVEFIAHAMHDESQFRLTGRVADLDETVLGEPEHPSLALIFECGDEFARIVVPSAVWPPGSANFSRRTGNRGDRTA